jgi:hypothetical protein
VLPCISIFRGCASQVRLWLLRQNLIIYVLAVSPSNAMASPLPTRNRGSIFLRYSNLRGRGRGSARAGGASERRHGSGSRGIRRNRARARAPRLSRIPIAHDRILEFLPSKYAWVLTACTHLHPTPAQPRSSESPARRARVGGGTAGGRLLARIASLAPRSERARTSLSRARSGPRAALVRVARQADPEAEVVALEGVERVGREGVAGVGDEVVVRDGHVPPLQPPRDAVPAQARACAPRRQRLSRGQRLRQRQS